VRITPLGSIRFTWSANCEALIFETLGLRTLGLLIFVDFGRGVVVEAGFGNQGIQGCLEIAVAVGRGDGLLVVAVPGLPFFTLITIWLSSSALTSMQVSPSHSSP
jgi:hypothetical protein